MKVLSKLQFVAAGLIHESQLLTLGDMTHLKACTFAIKELMRSPDSVIVRARLEFGGWCFITQSESVHQLDWVPVEVDVVFRKDEGGKLTGTVDVGIPKATPILTRYLPYIRGW